MLNLFINAKIDVSANNNELILTASMQTENADIELTNSDGMTALDYSREKNYNKVEAMLEEYPK